MRNIKREIEEKEKELAELKELQEQMLKNKLLSSLKVGRYYIITDDKEWSNFRVLYICKYTGKNIYIDCFGSAWKLHFDGPVIIKKIDTYDKDDKLTTYVSYELSVNESTYVNDELSIEPVDINEVKKALRDVIKTFQ